MVGEPLHPGRRRPRRRGRAPADAPPLTEEQILSRLTVAQVLQWADHHYECAGCWPTHASGPVLAAPGERWSGVNCALLEGLRGLPAGTSLARLLERERQVPHPLDFAPLDVPRILEWLDHQFRRFGRWPTHESGPVAAAPEEDWGNLDSALRAGCRGLPGGSSLARLLAERRLLAPPSPRRNHASVAAVSNSDPSSLPRALIPIGDFDPPTLIPLGVLGDLAVRSRSSRLPSGPLSLAR